MTLDAFERIVMRVANQTPVRWFTDGLHDQSFSHFGLWVYCDSNPTRLIADLVERGMELDGQRDDGRFVVHMFTIEKGPDR